MTKRTLFKLYQTDRQQWRDKTDSLNEIRQDCQKKQDKAKNIYTEISALEIFCDKKIRQYV
jgi:hypothetical protein